MSHQTGFGNKPIQPHHVDKALPKMSLWILLALLSVMAFRLAPTIDIFVLNDEQKQCARMWPGDEYVYYSPPTPWKEAEPDENGIIQSQFGSCNLRNVEIYNSQSAASCCKQLGYTFIGEIKGEVTHRDYGLILGQIISLFGVPIAVILVIVILVINSVSKKQETTGEQNGS